MKCEICTEFEIVHHLMFECIVARALWDLFEEVFYVHVSNFESIATKWLCNKKSMHFNVVSSAVLWGYGLIKTILCLTRLLGLI
jgi:hypothetical protein